MGNVITGISMSLDGFIAGPGDDVQIMTRFTKIGSRFERVDLEPVRLQPLVKGVAQAL